MKKQLNSQSVKGLKKNAELKDVIEAVNLLVKDNYNLRLWLTKLSEILKKEGIIKPRPEIK